MNCVASFPPAKNELPAQTLRLLRLEGLAVAVLSAVLYARCGTSWWLFAALWLMPDLSMLAYLAGPRWGSIGYNVVHSYLIPALVAAIALLLHRLALLPYTLIWFNHIGLDRLMGYGLKSAEGFGITHLKHLGRKTNRTRLS